MTKTYFSLLSVIVALTLAVCAPGTALAAKYKIRFAHDGAPDAVYSLTYQKFGELAARYSDGRVSVKIYENAVLGGDREVSESTQRGDLQMGGCGTSNLGIFWPSAMAFDLPFIIDPAKKAALYRELNEGELGRHMNEQLAKVNLMALVYADCPNRHYMTNTRNIPDLESLKGVKMRTTASQVDNMLAETLKMTPAPMGFAEIYTALQQGTIDGELISFADYFSNRRGDVIHYALPTSHSFTCMVGLISRSYYDSLPADVQAALKKAAVEACAYGQELVKKMD
ncbi:MAG: TRAP transporter substrate-binding protein, partial [Desulfovibrionaceae bacterium]|nr:TRAP transporter substrate-binding protein [Desulfovibrionaceae bacterium]